MRKIPKEERKAGFYAAIKYRTVAEQVPVGEVMLMVNAVLRAAAKVREKQDGKE